jgi:hypothetical protein
MDPVKEWRDQGAMDLENSAGNNYASMLSRARRSELRFSAPNQIAR